MASSSSRRHYERIGGDPFVGGRKGNQHTYENLRLTIDEENSQDEEEFDTYQRPSNMRDELLPQLHPPSDHHATLDGNVHGPGQISNLDDFFCRVYNYHQRGGFACMLLEDVAQLFQFAFVVCFSVFLLQCVDYDILFSNKLPPHNNGSRTEKLHLSDALLSNCAAHLHPFIVLCLIVAIVFWTLRFVRLVLQVSKYLEIKQFFGTQLMVTSSDLCNLTWYEISGKIIDAQENAPFCINQSELTELDICMRILRRKNYFVAMVNQGILPPKIEVPFVGEICIFTNGLKLNLEWLFFTGPWAPWSDYFTLRKEYK